MNEILYVRFEDPRENQLILRALRAAVRAPGALRGVEEAARQVAGHHSSRHFAHHRRLILLCACALPRLFLLPALTAIARPAA